MNRTRSRGLTMVVPGLFALLSAGCSFDGSGLSPAGDNDSDSSPDAGRGAGLPDAAATADGEQPPDAGAGALEPGELRSRSTGTPPTLDGDDAEWDQETFRLFRMSEAMKYFGVHQDYGFDAEVRFASMHDDEFIYFFFAVTDDQIVDDSDISYQDDAIELYLDAKGDMSGPYGDDDHWIVIESGGSYESLGPASISIEGEMLLTDEGYNFELKVEKDAMNGTFTGGVAGFNIGLVDDDGLGDPDADAYGLWFVRSGDHCEDCCADDPNPQAWCDTSLFGRLLLLP